MKPAQIQNLYERFFTDRGEVVSVQYLNQLTNPPSYEEVLTARAVINGYSPQELLSGAIPENSIRVLILQEDLGDYQIKLKQDRILIREIPYVPQSINNLVRSSSGVTYAIEVRCIS
jgi:hypothetical protein